MIEPFASRRELARKAMHEQGLGALLVSHHSSRYYLSGFELHDPQYNESAGRLLLFADGKDWLCTDARYLDAALRLWDENRILVYTSDAPGQMAVLAKEHAYGPVGFEARTLSLDEYERFSQGITLQRADGLVEKLRRIKDSDEIARMRRACKLNHQLMQWLPSSLVNGRSEADIAWNIEKFFRERGASELAFASIVGSGANAALPHYIPSKTTLLPENQLVLVDVGCRVDDYCSDQTRTFWTGSKPAAQFQKTLGMVKEAQHRAIEAIRPGVCACEVFQAAATYFDEQGVLAAFTHSLGHGIGLDTHENPSLNSRNETVLEPGMIVTVEPGLYYPQWGGVRWEYMVLVTEDGCEVL